LVPFLMEPTVKPQIQSTYRITLSLYVDVDIVASSGLHAANLAERLSGEEIAKEIQSCTAVHIEEVNDD